MNTHRAAGGLKFKVGKVFFKFATDTHKLYGSDTAAQKAAANELRAINAVVDACIPSLHITLSSLVYCRGVYVYV
jgi:hypothetical protein